MTESLSETEKKLYGSSKIPSPPPPQPLPPPPPPPPRHEISQHTRKRLTWGFAAVIVVGVLFAGFVFWRGFFGFSSNRVALTLTGPAIAEAGETVLWRVAIKNNNRIALDQAHLVFEFPENSRSETGERVRTKEHSVGRIESGEERVFEFSAVILGGEGFDRTARARFRFEPAESSLVFQKEAAGSVHIDRFPVLLEVTGPTETLSGETIPVQIRLLNESDWTFNDLRVRLEFPSGFTFVSSQSPLEDSRRVWPINDIAPDEEKMQEIFGTVFGLAGEGKIFRAFIEHREGSTWMVYKESAHVPTLAAVPLELDIRLRETGDDEDAVSRGDRLQYEVRWRNNFDIPLTNVVVRAVLEGDMYDFETLNTNGNVIAGREINWTAAHVPQLASLGPGEEGGASFSIALFDDFPRGIVNPTLHVTSSIESPTEPPGLAVERIRTVRMLESKINGELELDSYALYNEPNPAFRNSGPFPPRVGEATTLTVHWEIASFANEFENVTVRAVLPSGVDWAAESRVPAGDTIEFNEFTREVAWTRSAIGPNVGVLSSRPGVIFKIIVQPPPAARGRPMTILDETRIQAGDAFTGARFDNTVPELTSSLPRDTGAGSGRGAVE